MNPEIIISTIGAIMTTISILPQAIKTIKTKETEALSFWMYFLSTIGVLCYFIFGLMIKNYPLIIGNSIIFVFSSIILAIKTYNLLHKKDERV